MEWNRQNFLSFWDIFCPFIPLMILKTKILKKTKCCWCAVLLSIMDLCMSSLGTLVPEGPWGVFYATRCQVYWGLTHSVVLLLILWFDITHTNTHTHTQRHTVHFFSIKQQLHFWHTKHGYKNQNLKHKKRQGKKLQLLTLYCNKEGKAKNN